MKKAFLFAIAAAIVFPMISMADEPAAKPEKTEKVQKERTGILCEVYELDGAYSRIGRCDRCIQRTGYRAG